MAFDEDKPVYAPFFGEFREYWAKKLMENFLHSAKKSQCSVMR